MSGNRDADRPKGSDDRCPGDVAPSSQAGERVVAVHSLPLPCFNSISLVRLAVQLSKMRGRRHQVLAASRHDLGEEFENAVSKHGTGQRLGASRALDRIVRDSPRIPRRRSRRAGRPRSARHRFGRRCRRRSRPRRRVPAQSQVHRRRGPRSGRSRNLLLRETARRGNFDSNRR